MAFEKVKTGIKGATTSQHKHNLLFTLGLNSNEDDGAPNGKRKMKPLREEHHLNRGTKDKIVVKTYACNKCLPKIPPNLEKKTF
jgi:hypothetical protein